MSVTKTVTKNENQCPKCGFAGLHTSNKSNFSQELVNRFPKGFAQENHPKIKITKISGVDRQEFVKDSKTNEIIFNKIRRCPVCGFMEGDKIE